MTACVFTVSLPTSMTVCIAGTVRSPDVRWATTRNAIGQQVSSEEFGCLTLAASVSGGRTRLRAWDYGTFHHRRGGWPEAHGPQATLLGRDRYEGDRARDRGLPLARVPGPCAGTGTGQLATGEGSHQRTMRDRRGKGPAGLG